MPERWDVVLVDLGLPDARHLCRGPLVRVGADPGPAGLRLDGRRGLADTHVVIELLDGRVLVTPVGAAVVRVADDEASLDRALPLREPTWVAPGAVIELGSPPRATRLHVAEVRRVGAWRAAARQAGDWTTGMLRRRGLAPQEVRPPVLFGVIAVATFVVLTLPMIALVAAFWVYQRAVAP
ncbi:MAG: hypothetical protein ACOZNI_00135 [Myxococcota bacterium]